MKRRLAAILALDVVGYSRLMAADEEGTLQRLRSLHSDIIVPAIKIHEGRVVKVMGDGLLAEFPSVVEAVEAAAAIQLELTHSTAQEQADVPVQLRIGVNLGDIIHEGSDIFGDGVNVAARIESLADPGSVFVSGTVFEHVRMKAQYVFEDLGEKTLKNIDRPIRVYRIALGGEGSNRSDSAAWASAGTTYRKPTIAVLAFENMSGDANDDYFSDGLTEDLITELARFKELAVISRNSSFAFKNKATSLKEIGRQLGARYIVEGSVRRAANRIRISAQLIDTTADSHIWADRYDRDLEDIFEVQDDVVRRVASTLVDRVEYSNLKRVERLSEDQITAYDLYLRGREHFFSWSMNSNRLAREALTGALELEPESAATLALYAEVLFRDWLNGWSTGPDRDFADAYSAAKRAVSIDGQDSRTQIALAMLHLFHRQYDQAKLHFETALEANPNDTRVPIYFSRYEVLAGSPERAVELCRSALELNPFGKYNWNLAIANFAARQYQDAITACESIRDPPETVLALLAASHAMIGHSERSAEVVSQLLQDARNSPMMSKFSRSEDWEKFFVARWPFKETSDMERFISALRLTDISSLSE